MAEIGPEPWNPALFAMPRATASFAYTPGDLFDGISQIAGFGVWTHFTHADDVMDVPREGWSHPYLRNRTPLPGVEPTAKVFCPASRPGSRGQGAVSQAAFRTTNAAHAVFAAHRSQRCTVDIDGDRLTVDGAAGSAFELRRNGPGRGCCVRVTGGEVAWERHDDGMRSWLIRMSSRRARVEILQKG